MSTPTISTVVKMLESLPQSAQEQVVERLREYIADLQDDLEWNAQFSRTQEGLVAAARRAKEQIAAGKAEPMQLDQL